MDRADEGSRSPAYHPVSQLSVERHAFACRVIVAGASRPPSTANSRWRQAMSKQ